jgi:hypothetical protein
MAFKVAQSEAKQQEQYQEPSVGDGSTTEKSTVEVPFTEYRAENKVPYTAKYLNIESVWETREMESDVQDIEDYLSELVTRGKLDNNIETVGKKLKSIEKMANIDQLESRGERIIKLASFIQYLKLLERRHNEQNITDR